MGEVACAFSTASSAAFWERISSITVAAENLKSSVFRLWGRGAREMNGRDWSSLCCCGGNNLIWRRMEYILEESGKKRGITERSSGTEISCLRSDESQT